jgi:hypothetical protein
MRNIPCILLFFLLIYGSFYCSDLPFDSATNLGKDLLDNIINFDGKVFKDSLTVTGSLSYVDTTGDIKSGIIGLPSLPAGKWENEMSIIYFGFNKSDTILPNARYKSNSDTLVSFIVNIGIDKEISTISDNSKIVFGTCEHKINSYSSDDTTITHKDTIIDTTSFDTLFISDSIIGDTIKIPLHDSLFLNDTLYKDTVSFYLRECSNIDSSLIFINSISLNEVVKDTDTLDTTSNEIYSIYRDCSIFESGFNITDSTLVSSSLGERYTRFELDLVPFWNNMDDSVEYKNIPLAKLTLPIDKILIHKSSGTEINAQYSLMDTPFLSLDDITEFRTSADSLTSTSKNIVFTLENFLLSIKGDKKPSEAPKKAYLYVRVSNAYFAKIFWKGNNNLPFEYVFTNSH